MLRYRSAWHTLGGDILRCSAPQNDIIQQRAITTNERFFLPTVVRMTVRLGWDSSLRLRSVQNDNRVIPSVREESLVTTTWGKILHFTAFHSERHCTVRAVSLNRRCFATLSMTSKCHSQRMWGIPGYYWWEILRCSAPQNDNPVISNACERSHTIGFT